MGKVKTRVITHYRQVGQLDAAYELQVPGRCRGARTYVVITDNNGVPQSLFTFSSLYTCFWIFID